MGCLHAALRLGSLTCVRVCVRVCVCAYSAAFDDLRFTTIPVLKGGQLSSGDHDGFLSAPPTASDTLGQVIHGLFIVVSRTILSLLKMGESPHTLACPTF